MMAVAKELLDFSVDQYIIKKKAYESLQDEIAKKHGYKVVRHVHQLFDKPIN